MNPDPFWVGVAVGAMFPSGIVFAAVMIWWRLK
jgi:hypothetical protein